MSRNDFAENYAFGVHKHRRLLDIFYKHFCYDARFVCIGESEKSAFSERIQRELKTDTVIQTSVHTSYGVEEKVVSWPAHDRGHTALFLETRSCTNRGYERDGWMVTCQADLLLYAFEVKDVGLLIYLLDFPQLKRWFEQEYLPHLPRPGYGLSVMADENRTEGRVVAMETIFQAVPTRCFLVTFEERFYPFKRPLLPQQVRERFLQQSDRTVGPS